MTFSLSGFINGFTGSKKINKVLLSPIWLAVVIILVLTIILYFILRSYIDDGLYGVLAKQAIYTLLVTIGIVFLHDRAMNQKFEQDHRDKRKEEIIQTSIPELSELRNMAKPDIPSPQSQTTGMIIGSSSAHENIEANSSGIVTVEPPTTSLGMSSDGTVGDDYFV